MGMSELRDFITKLGFSDVKSLLQSGNLIFKGKATTPLSLEHKLETAVEKQLGLRTIFLVRTAAEWREIVEQNPFPEFAKQDPSHFVLMPLKDPPTPESVKALQAAIKGRETVKVRGREAYFTYPDGIGNSRLTIAIIEKNLGTQGTGRNWNTVLKLAALTSA